MNILYVLDDIILRKLQSLFMHAFLYLLARILLYRQFFFGQPSAFCSYRSVYDPFLDSQKVRKKSLSDYNGKYFKFTTENE